MAGKLLEKEDLDFNLLNERQRFVNIIQTNSDLLLRLINDILDISRLL